MQQMTTLSLASHKKRAGFAVQRNFGHINMTALSGGKNFMDLTTLPRINTPQISF